MSIPHPDQPPHWLDDAVASELLAEHGSPLYVYDESTIRARLRELADLVAYRPWHPSISIKANGNPHLLAMAREEGLSGDAMSPGEILLLEHAGFDSDHIFFIPNNVGVEEMRFAAERGILTSMDSLDQLRTFGACFPGRRVALRVNPGTGDGHHEKVVTAGDRTKFGILPGELAEARRIAQAADLRIVGLNQHIGSGFLEPSKYLLAATILLDLALDFPDLDFIDFGGGFGIPYHAHHARLDIADLGRRLDELLVSWVAKTGRRLEARIEPGRYYCAEGGALLGTVHAVKPRGEIVIAGTDLGFNVLQRPAMYDAFHRIDLIAHGRVDDRPRTAVTWVGNICESGDILGEDRTSLRPRVGDHVRVRDAGAYGWAMSSSYNGRPRAAEVLLCADGTRRVIRRRETHEDLLRQLALD